MKYRLRFPNKYLLANELLNFSNNIKISYNVSWSLRKFIFNLFFVNKTMMGEFLKNNTDEFIKFKKSVENKQKKIFEQSEEGRILFDMKRKLMNG